MSYAITLSLLGRNRNMAEMIFMIVMGGLLLSITALFERRD